MTLAPEHWTPCSDGARERGDPLAGTAPRGLRWFLLEVPAAWGPNALLDAPFDREIGRALVRRVEAAEMRILAIRRTGRRTAPPAQRWAIVDSRPGAERIVWGEVAHAADLLEVPLDGSTGVPSDEPVYAVCAHGRHDRCCAVRGRRVATALAAARPEQTWECSHLGGDRFAGTMVVLPEGLYSGYADDGDPVRIAEAYEGGRVVPELLRGRSSLTHPVQAAQHYARREFGDERIAAYPPVDEIATDDGWIVRLALDGGASVVVDLVAESSPPLRSTCAATRFVRVRQWALRGIRVEG
ncbi:sucrase ferredoxin [Agromyces sp. CFH 90414]|uniref:Sucrase ferredoxin n=1 Tax=Agromyces agglutinans TaxID=2662258 RepID=A0A6I2F6G5_9MICO|nr:sucrase ferredoxin [Agromyces agglutinans]MRG60312.1 sucrase ferredoxin [Agromyces agglutinans]